MRFDGFSFSLSAKFTKESSAAEAEALLARLRLRGEDEVPSAPGFCIWRGIFVEPLPPHKTEHIAMHMGLADHPDLAVGMSSMPGGGADPDLLARVAETDASASADELLRVTKLRAQQRVINGIGGEEVLEKVRELNFTTGYGFMWEARGTTGDPMRPSLLLLLETGTSPRAGGKPVDSSLHEDAVLALWERISSTLRVRPSGDPQASSAESGPPTLPLGATVRAGEPCPHAGWWRCGEGGPGVDVQGGAVQFIRQGETMPQALLLPRQTMWQRLRSVQPSVEPTRLTTWTLVDKRQRPRLPSIVALAPAGLATRAADAGAEPTSAPALGTGRRTGDMCPASGWWRCDEANALDGTRWFGRGSVLPAATFLVPAGLFGRSPGPDVIQRRSTWRLVRRAESAHAQA